MPWLERQVPGPTPGYVMPPSAQRHVVEAYHRDLVGPVNAPPAHPDLVDEIFCHLKVLRINRDHHRGRTWECECQVLQPDGSICGKLVTAATSSLYNGLQKSCGCIARLRGPRRPR